MDDNTSLIKEASIDTLENDYDDGPSSGGVIWRPEDDDIPDVKYTPKPIVVKEVRKIGTVVEKVLDTYGNSVFNFEYPALLVSKHYCSVDMENYELDFLAKHGVKKVAAFKYYVQTRPDVWEDCGYITLDSIYTIHRNNGSRPLSLDIVILRKGIIVLN